MNSHLHWTVSFSCHPITLTLISLFLFIFFSFRVVENGEKNRMTYQSVAIVFGPTLLKPEKETGNIAVHTVYQNQIVELILLELNSIFGRWRFSGSRNWKWWVGSSTPSEGKSLTVHDVLCLWTKQQLVFCTFGEGRSRRNVWPL